jgi:tetratricopeptide (TPR) repeat protein
MRNLFAVLSLALAFHAPSWSADSGPPAKTDVEMTNARSLIAKKDWAGALKVLESYTQNNTSSADGFNLLGYSYRNLLRYNESLVAYKQALTLDPVHRGAHEYIGMAYVSMGKLDDAKIHLDALNKICTFSCEEYRDLKKAYEAARKAPGGKG